jgi:hypothetical protein
MTGSTGRNHPLTEAQIAQLAGVSVAILRRMMDTDEHSPVPHTQNDRGEFLWHRDLVDRWLASFQ